MKYLIWLQAVLRAGSNKSGLLLEKFGNAKEVYRHRNGALLNMNILSRAESERAQKLTDNFGEEVISACRKNNIKIVGIFDNCYPEAFRHIINPPLVLYIKGSLPDFNSNPSICIVGPREVSEFGKKSAYSLGYRMSKAGIIVVSGCAKGADRAAHIGALKSGGTTVGILPCGILNGYLKENASLREAISKNGCLISEYTPNQAVTQSSFKVRNRLLAAITHSTVVVEADEKSGALITAAYACDYGKELFVIPGNPSLNEYKGSNKLLRDGARPLLDSSDIFGEYIAVYGDKIDLEKAYKREENEKRQEISKKDIKNFPFGLSKTAEMLYNKLDKQKFSADDFLSLGMTDDELISALTELEMEHLIKASVGGFYEKIEL